jgi:4,5-DOPA dioxygenase extradiol
MASLQEFKKLTDSFPEQETLMPVLFVGHGSPMNGIEINEFSTKWSQLAKQINKPSAVLVISAHWFIKGTRITAMDYPSTIHDFGGFPQALFQVQYPAPGSLVLAEETKRIIHTTNVELDHDWGLDHGTWTIVRHMYPEADIPVLQLSIDYTKPASFHYELAKELFALRKRGVLIIGSGNMVHNLRMIAWDKLEEPGFGFDWALQMNDTLKYLINEGNHESLVQYEKLGKAALLSIPTAEHYLPLIYSLGLSSKKDPILFFNDKAVGGSLTMTSVQFG